MSIASISDHANAFLELALRAFDLPHLSDVNKLLDRAPVPAAPVVIKDYKTLSQSEKEQITERYFGPYGVASFVVLNSSDVPELQHPIHHLAQELQHQLHLIHPIPHPLETHPTTLKEFGGCDGTAKIYHVPNKGIALGNESLTVHQDGHGSGGTVETAVLYLDSAGAAGGYTYFQNLVLAALLLAQKDREAYEALFQPNAITVLRASGTRTLKITTPVLYVGETGQPQFFIRQDDGEYRVHSRHDCHAANRGLAHLYEYAQPFAKGSSFVHLTAAGHGCYIRNLVVGHGRTPFVNIPGNQRRVVSRKWYATQACHAYYRHAPGMFMASQFSHLYPDLTEESCREGEWRYDQEWDQNVRVA